VLKVWNRNSCNGVVAAFNLQVNLDLDRHLTVCYLETRVLPSAHAAEWSPLQDMAVQIQQRGVGSVKEGGDVCLASVPGACDKCAAQRGCWWGNCNGVVAADNLQVIQETWRSVFLSFLEQ
jgi:hypothetical protein